MIHYDNQTPYKGKVPVIEWIKWDKDNPPIDADPEETFLVLLREDDYDNGATWRYHVDTATPYRTYIDDFWDTSVDWYEGQRIEILAYAETPYYVKESELVDGGNIHDQH